MASFDCGTVNFGDRIFEGDVPFLRRMAEAFRRASTTPELECFDTGHVGLALQLHEEGLLDAPLRVQFVVGIPGTGVPASIAQVEHMRRLLPEGSPWSVCAPGRHQLGLNTYCLIAGGHVRTGLEDNLHYGPGRLSSNAELVERAVRMPASSGAPSRRSARSARSCGSRSSPPRRARAARAGTAASGTAARRGRPRARSGPPGT
jgi:3-keto-5-aminohexanoate cleavage enzyme